MSQPLLSVLNEAVDRAIEGGPEPLRDAFRQLSSAELNTLYYQLVEIKRKLQPSSWNETKNYLAGRSWTSVTGCAR